ncbi:hypothetical protein [uncultured Lactococcus sp.]|uniref:hypothetical protein n=1 Tax=uncultured Lactococcus sp. TaxID=167973 RepID=UPI00259507F0|nr:hypothetical protein [uncultured Lactococcus sp.]
MNDFNQDMQNLLNAYDSNWEDYLILREQFIEKYSLSVDNLEDHLLPYSKEMVKKIRDEKMQLVTADEFVKLHKEYLTAIRENDKLQEQLNTAKKALEYIINSNDTAFGFVNSNLRRYVEDALAAIGGADDENRL